MSSAATTTLDFHVVTPESASEANRLREKAAELLARANELKEEMRARDEEFRDIEARYQDLCGQVSQLLYGEQRDGLGRFPYNPVRDWAIPPRPALPADVRR
jgi:hypothetical protein